MKILTCDQIEILLFNTILVSAMAGFDYSFINAVLTIPANLTDGTIQCTDVTIIDDGVLEEAEMFRLGLAIITPNPRVVVGNAVLSITIMTDADC